jgi:hypothetical protein
LTLKHRERADVMDAATFNPRKTQVRHKLWPEMKEATGGGRAQPETCCAFVIKP